MVFSLLLAQGNGTGNVSDAKIALLMGLATVIGGAITWAFNAVTNWRMQSRKEKKEDEKTIIDHLEALNERVTQENREFREEMHSLRNDLNTERLRVERLLGHIRYLEHLMKSKRIAFDPYVGGDPGSNPEIPIPQASPPQKGKTDGK